LKTKKELILLWAKKWIHPKYISLLIKNKLLISNKELFFLEYIEEDIFNSIKKEIDLLEKKYPIEYILWSAYFYNRKFFVNKNVLIPRSDSEIIVNETKKYINKLKNVNLFDIWTWSWILWITLNLEDENQNIKNTTLVDISNKALEVAIKNIDKFNLKNKIKTINSSFENLDFREIKNLIIIANLPYIKSYDIKNMDKEVYLYEPKIALYGWEKTWFELYEKLINKVFSENKNACMFIEIWFDQYDYSKYFLSKKWLKFEYFKDLNNIYRVIKIKY